MSKRSSSRKGSGTGHRSITETPPVETQPTDYAAVFRRKLQERTNNAATIEREFDGLPLIVRRLNMTGWLRTGRMPEYFASFYSADADEQAAAKKRMSSEELAANLQFQKDVVRECVVLPHIVFEDRELGPNEISFKELAESNTVAIEILIMWQIAGCPDIPVMMKGGETAQLSEIEGFREKQGPVQGAGAGNGEVWWNTQPTVRHP